MTKTLHAIAIAFLLFGRLASAVEPTLAQLQTTTSPPTKPHLVLVKPGVQQPQAPVAGIQWKLVPGEVLRTAQRPGERVIDLYTGTGSAPVLLCRIITRYYPHPNGWIPFFQLNEEPAVTKIGGRWQPLQLPQGVPLTMVQHGNTLPNAEGFYPQLEFGLASGSLTITAWQVR